jgi:lipopolysaccharide export system permease protein
MMRTIDRYILAKTLWPLTACVAVALLALLLERMVRLMDLVVNKGGPLFLVLKMLANLIPHYLGIAVPAAFFVGIVLAVARLSGDSELDAIHSMGVGLRRILLPLMGLAAVLMVVSAIIIGFLQPYTRYAYRALVYTVTHTAWNNALERGNFFNGFGDMTIMVDGFSEGGRTLSGVFLHEAKPEGTTTTTAEQGKLYRARNDYKLVLSLHDGARIETDRSKGAATVLSFDRLDVPLDLEEFAPVAFRARGDSDRELTLTELFDARSKPSATLPLARIDSEISARLVRIVSLLFMPLLAIPLGIVSRRARRSVGLIVGLILLIFYHHVLQFGEELADKGVSPLITLWGPCLLFAGFGLWAFHATSVRPGYNPVMATIDRISDSVEYLGDLLLRRRAAA